MWWLEKGITDYTAIWHDICNHFHQLGEIFDGLLDQNISKLNLTLLLLGFISFIHYVVPFIKDIHSKYNFTTLMLKVWMSLPVLGGIVNNYITKELDKTYDMLDDMLYKNRKNPFEKLPEKPLLNETVKNHIESLHAKHKHEYATGLLSGTIYHRESDEFNELMENTMSLFTDTNAFDYNNFKGVTQMNADIVNATKKLFHGDEDTYGMTTVGGSESIMSSLIAYKLWAKDVKGITKPNFVCYDTLHAAFSKGCHIFNIEFRGVPVNADGHGNPSDLEKYIDSNTIALGASACNYAHGIHDDIASIAKIALKHNIGFHVDNCLGGFVNCFISPETVNAEMTPFDFRVEGVTTISADTHKYGYGPKGMSVVLFKPKSLFEYLIYTSVDYAFTTTTTGNERAGAIVAGTWAAMNKLGLEGYVKKTKGIYDATQKLVKELKKIPDIKLYGQCKYNMIWFDGNNGLTAGAISGIMKKEHKWELNDWQKPYVTHYLLMDSNVDMTDKFIKDLKDSIESLKKGGTYKKSGQQAIYGVSSTITDKNLLDKIVFILLDGEKATTSERARMSKGL